MFCSKCGKALNAEDLFCAHCGVPVKQEATPPAINTSPGNDLPPLPQVTGKFFYIVIYAMIAMCVIVFLIIALSPSNPVSTSTTASNEVSAAPRTRPDTAAVGQLKSKSEMASAPTVASQNEANDRLLSSSEKVRALALGMAVGNDCQGTRAFYMGISHADHTIGNVNLQDKNMAYWSVACANGNSYEVQIAPDSAGSSRMMECSLAAVVATGCFRKIPQTADEPRTTNRGQTADDKERRIHAIAREEEEKRRAEAEEAERREQERINAARQAEAVIQAKAQEASRIAQSKPRSGVPLGLTFDAFKKRYPSAQCVDPTFCVVEPATDALFGKFTPMKESFFLSNGTVIQVRAKFNEGADIRKFIYTNFPDDGHGNGETINYSYTASYDAIVTISQP